MIHFYAISAFLGLHHHHKTSNDHIFSKLICNFYLNHPPSCRRFDPYDAKNSLSLLDGWVPASSLTNYKLAWKMGTLLALDTAEHSDLTLLCIDDQHLFLQHNASIFIPASGGKMDQLGHLPTQKSY